MHVFAEDPGSGANPPKGFGFLQGLINGECTFVNDMDPPNTLYHFANADMVISSGKISADTLQAKWQWTCQPFPRPPPPPHTPIHTPRTPTTNILGSSFPLITELLSPKPIMIATPPKESADCHFYDTFDTFKTNNSGHMVGKSLSEARASIVDRYEIFHLRRVPETLHSTEHEAIPP